MMFLRGLSSTIVRQSVWLALMLGFSAGMLAVAQTKVVVTLPKDASAVERIAADELTSHLQVLYPSTQFATGDPQEGVPVIYLGTAQELPESYAAQVKSKLDHSDSFAIRVIDSRVAVIAGVSPRATLYAVDALLEKLGFGFYLSYNTAPPPSQAVFSFAGWELEDAPIAGERLIFNWHNFLSGCSAWNLEDWQRWITQAERMRFNTIMVHAYGNNPMFSLSLHGAAKPTGSLTNTRTGRDWGTEDVLDVRKIVGGEGLFSGPVFGADASMAPDKEAAATALMQSVFKFAAERGMGITFALDIDSEASNPQNVIATLPDSARFKIRFQSTEPATRHDPHDLELADPDSREGYLYYKSEIEQLMKLYPQITQVAVWFRGAPASPSSAGSPWNSLKPEEFPVAWREEYRAAMAANPALKDDPRAPGMFAMGKVAKAFRKALNETGHAQVTLAAGSWDFGYLPTADAFMPAGTTLMPLDANYVFPSDPVQESVRAVGRHRPVTPIVWAQHDDREYAGRSYVPFAGLGSMLQWSNSAGYGVIHWTTRPLDLFFKNVADQVWTGSEDEPLDTTAAIMAKRTFGSGAQELGKRYLLDWIYNGPAFGRETSDKFISLTLDAENEAIGAKGRLELLAQMEPLARDAAVKDWVGYFEDWERYAQGVFQAQSTLQKSEAALKAGDMTLARQEIAAASPENAIEQYSKTIRHGTTSRGEKGILISMNLRWLPYFEAQRQAVGLEPLQIEFAPTYQDAVAQQPGAYTFDFNRSKRVIEVLGSAELGMEVHEFEAGSGCASGIEVQFPLVLTVGGLAGTSLQERAYRLRLAMPEADRILFKSRGNHQEVTAASEIEVEASGGAVHFLLSPIAGPARVCGLTLMRQE
jgi:hypothetical protein